MVEESSQAAAPASFLAQVPHWTTVCSLSDTLLTIGSCVTLGAQAGASRATSVSPGPRIRQLSQTRALQMAWPAPLTQRLRQWEANAASSSIHRILQVLLQHRRRSLCEPRWLSYESTL